MNTLEKFLKYVTIDTQSDPETGTHPSTQKQFDLARILVDELKALGLEATLDEHCYVYSALPATAEGLPAIGFIAHMDTEPVCSGKNVPPRIVHYQGGDIPLANGDVISASAFPDLENYLGQDIVVTDGTTLLGADDKAGVAEIMAAVEYLAAHPELPHGKIGIAFTPDEEIGEGPMFFDVKRFGCDFAYTIDGEKFGEISYETFNAAGGKITLRGVNIHPGQAKNKMISCVTMANELMSLFPKDETPATTEGREGYFHFEEVNASVEHGTLKFIIRDHDKEKFQARKEFVRRCVAQLQQVYGADRIQLELKDSYYNCAEVILPHRHLIENAQEAIRMAGGTPFSFPMRGGTDGATLSFMGLPCPNLATGGMNAHSVHEYIPVPALEQATQVILNLVGLYARPDAKH